MGSTPSSTQPSSKTHWVVSDPSSLNLSPSSSRMFVHPPLDNFSPSPSPSPKPFPSSRSPSTSSHPSLSLSETPSTSSRTSVSSSRVNSSWILERLLRHSGEVWKHSRIHEISGFHKLQRYSSLPPQPNNSSSSYLQTRDSSLLNVHSPTLCPQFQP